MLRCQRLFPILLAACAAAPGPAHPALLPVVADVRPLVQRHLREMSIPGISLALLDVDPLTGESRLWVEGFGDAGADSIHRVASISKLFTDTAAMVLVERGELDLDVRIDRYLPEFSPHNPYETRVTLRSLMRHTAGIVREPPVGHYYDPSGPSLAQTVLSLNGTALVHEPGTAFKYSNPGVGVIGEVIACVTGKSFEQAVDELVLAPLGLRESDFRPRSDLVARQAEGLMWTFDGRDIPTPGFAFGYGPAANLRSTVTDLVRFARSWFPSSRERVLTPRTQEAMWRLPEGRQEGAGLGFYVGRLDGHRMVGHDGLVYGFASSLSALPDEGLAVAVVCTLDFAHAVAGDLCARALRAALANRRGERLASADSPQPVGVVRARQLAGLWRCGENWVQLHERDGELIYDPNIGMRTRMRRLPDGRLVADDPLGIGGRVLREIEGDGLRDCFEDPSLEQIYRRDDRVPDPCHETLLPYLGEYGWDHNVLIAYEDQGRLGVLIEWVVRDLPEPVGPDTFRFLPGMFGGDLLRFERDEQGSVTAAVVGGARFPRRPAPSEGGFRVAPSLPIAELIAEARTAAPPQQPAGLRAFDLVDIASLAPTIRLDVRYASSDNLLGVPVYPRPVAMLQRPAAAALRRVHEALAGDGLGLVVFDAYRPWWVTKAFWDATPEAQKDFVANPAHGSRHNRGCAVDLSLYDLATGEVVTMPSAFDEFTARASVDYPGGTSRQRHFRERLREAMLDHGFEPYPGEWWHFDFCDWRRYPVGNESLR